MEVLEKAPTVWDDVAVLKAEPGDCVVIARRSGRRWFVGGMNDEEAREMKLPLQFLDKGTAYHAIVFSDVPGSRDAQRNVIQVTSESVLDASLEPRGGVAVMIEPALMR